MHSNKSFVKISALVVGLAGVAAGTVIGYYAYVNRRKNEEDKDEGIGDVDSIVSEGEVEEASLSQLPLRSTSLDPSSNEEQSVLGSSVNSTSNKSSTDVEKSASVLSNSMTKTLNVLVLGLDGCGKSSMLDLLAHNNFLETYIPTVGIKSVQIVNDNGIGLNIIEVGSDSLAPSHWEEFTRDCIVFVYMVDGSNHSNFNQAKDNLKNFLDVASLVDVNCLLISNKQDVEGARKANEVFNEKFLDEIAMKGISNITLLNSICVKRYEEASDRDVILNVIFDLTKDSR